MAAIDILLDETTHIISISTLANWANYLLFSSVKLKQSWQRVMMLTLLHTIYDIHTCFIHYYKLVHVLLYWLLTRRCVGAVSPHRHLAPSNSSSVIIRAWRHTPPHSAWGWWWGLGRVTSSTYCAPRQYCTVKLSLEHLHRYQLSETICWWGLT